MVPLALVWSFELFMDGDRDEHLSQRFRKRQAQTTKGRHTALPSTDPSTPIPPLPFAIPLPFTPSVPAFLGPIIAGLFVMGVLDRSVVKWVES